MRLRRSLPKLPAGLLFETVLWQTARTILSKKARAKPSRSAKPYLSKDPAWQALSNGLCLICLFKLADRQLQQNKLDTGAVLNAKTID